MFISDLRISQAEFQARLLRRVGPLPTACCADTGSQADKSTLAGLRDKPTAPRYRAIGPITMKRAVAGSLPIEPQHNEQHQYPQRDDQAHFYAQQQQTAEPEKGSA